MSAPGSQGSAPRLSELLSPAEGPGELGRLGPYLIREVLGTGGMGVVFRAEDPRLRTPVALKVMRPALRWSVGAIRGLVSLRHPHVVTTYEAGEDRGVPFLVMELLRGETLKDRLQRDSQLPLGEVLRIARETAAGLAVVHEHGIVHRDLKPGNLLLEAGSGRVKVLDFGLARVVGDPQTPSGGILGTPAYMAPEQVCGAAVDARADLFSLGCVLYRLCTGAAPFQGGGLGDLLCAVLDRQPAPPGALNPALPPALSDLLLRLLAKDPRERPASARALADILADLARSGLLDSAAVAPERRPPETAPPQRRGPFARVLGVGDPERRAPERALPQAEGTLDGSVTLWIDQLRAGDADAARKLCSHYSPSMARLARQKLQGKPQRFADEEDIVQTVWSQFWVSTRGGRFSFRNRNDLWRLLATCTTREVIKLMSYHRRQKRGGGRVLDEAALEHAQQSQGLEQIVDPSPSPERAAQVADTWQRLFADLPDPELRSIGLWKMEGYTNAEIAARLGCSVRTVERRLALVQHHCRAELPDLLPLARTTEARGTGMYDRESPCTG